jgi:hypothetical protein
MFCTDSNWGGDYWSRYMVSIDSFKKVDQQDCANLLIEREGQDEERWAMYQQMAQEKNWTAEELASRKEWCVKEFKTLKPEVIEWLNKNVADIRGENPKGWCVGSHAYQMRDGHSVNIWFARRKDAFNFIRTFSIYKKPTTYFDYFKEIRRELNLKKNILAVVDEFSDEIEEYVD